jgi:uncharacterized protein (DUF697 family)
MPITRAKKKPAAVSKAGKTAITPEKFIAGTEAPSERSPQALPAVSMAGHEEQALAVVEGFLPWAAGAGVVPLPGIDMALIMGVQLRMLAKLSEVYAVPFKEQAAKSVVATLLATLVQNTVLGGLGLALKSMPVLGSLLGIVVLPAVAVAGTFALGKVFITHFEAGGTFLDFDPRKVRDHFQVEFAKARAGNKN